MTKTKAPTKDDRNYVEVFGDVAALLDSARAASARSVNALMTATYWLGGRRIFEGEQKGKGRADYGEQLIERLSGDLTQRFGRGLAAEICFSCARSS